MVCDTIIGKTPVGENQSPTSHAPNAWTSPQTPTAKQILVVDQRNDIPQYAASLFVGIY